MSSPESCLLTPHEIARHLQVSRKTIYYWVSRSEIPYVKVGRHLRFQLAEVIEFFKSGNIDGQAPCHHDQLFVINRDSRSLTIGEGSHAETKGVRDGDT